MLQFPKLVYLNLKLSVLRVLEQIQILPLYLNKELLKIDLAYFRAYLFQNPYRICKKHFIDESEEIKYSFGETWVSSVPKLTRLLPIRRNDVLFELGSGTGRVSLWFQKVSGCRVVAVELVSDFIKKSKWMQKRVNNDQVTFLEKDILDVDYSDATIIYFYGTSFSDEFIYKLLNKWRTLKSGTRILTTSFHLNEYLEKPSYRVIDEYRASYPWGKCDLYLQEKL